jgi:O-antigen/teichoic acid export membrane protein
LDPQEITPSSLNSEAAGVAPGPVSASASRDRSLVGSLAWKAIGDWISQIFSWASLLIVVRLLSPADFGVVAMAMTLLPYLRCVGDFGISRVIVNFPDLTEDQIGQLNTFSALLGIASFGVAVGLAYPAALFFRTPRLFPVVIATSSALIAWGFRAVPEGLLTREMRFRSISGFDALNAIVAAAVTLAMAYFGFGYWALVWGNIVGVFLRAIVIISARPHRFAIPRLSSIGQHLLFGWHLLVSLVAMNSYQTLDNVTVGRVLGRTALGFYGMAWNLANIPLEKITSLVTTVVPTYLAAVQKEPAELRRYVRNLTEAMSLITFPATIGLGLVARELLPIAFGHKWDNAVVPLEILSIYAAFRSILALLPKVLTAVGNPRFVMWCDLFTLATLPFAFYIGSRWGTGGVALGWVAAYPIIALPLYWKTFSTIQMKTSEYLRALQPALNGSLVMAASVLLWKWKMPLSLPPAARLVIEILIGIVAYTGTLFLFHRKRIRTFLELMQSIRQRRRKRA